MKLCKKCKHVEHKHPCTRRVSVYVKPTKRNGVVTDPGGTQYVPCGCEERPRAST